MTFRRAVRSTPSLRAHFRDGLQALRNSDRPRLRCSDTRRLRGSVNLDDALRPTHSNDPVWDYAIGLLGNQTDAVVWLEVHPAYHVDEVLSKLQWLKRWLANNAPVLRRLQPHFCWVATGRISFGRGSPQGRKIAQMGLRFPTRQLDLDQFC